MQTRDAASLDASKIANPLYGLWGLWVRAPDRRRRRLPAHGSRGRPADGTSEHAGRRLGCVAGREDGAALPPVSLTSIYKLIQRDELIDWYDRNFLYL